MSRVMAIVWDDFVENILVVNSSRHWDFLYGICVVIFINKFYRGFGVAVYFLDIFCLFLSLLLVGYPIRVVVLVHFRRWIFHIILVEVGVLGIKVEVLDFFVSMYWSLRVCLFFFVWVLWIKVPFKIESWFKYYYNLCRGVVESICYDCQGSEKQMDEE